MGVHQVVLVPLRDSRVSASPVMPPEMVSIYDWLSARRSMPIARMCAIFIAKT